MIRAKQGVHRHAPQQQPGAPPAGAAHASEAAKRAPRAHYPAPYALIDLWVEHGGDAEAMQKAEIASFAKLLVTDTAQNLVRVFFLREKLKSLADGKWSGKRVHVIGAGDHGRRHRGLVRLERLYRDARRHQAGSHRRRHQARRRALRQDRPRQHAGACATRSTA